MYHKRDAYTVKNSGVFSKVLNSGGNAMFGLRLLS